MSTTTIASKPVSTVSPRRPPIIYPTRLGSVAGGLTWSADPAIALTVNAASIQTGNRKRDQQLRSADLFDVENHPRVQSESDSFHAVELADDEKPPLLRAYLKKWKFEVGVFFAGVGLDSSDEELRHIASDHPVFRVTDT